MRAVPDVAFDANPNTGVSVYDSTLYNSQSGWFTLGGTSVGAPNWAGMLAAGAHSAATLQTAKKIYGGGYRFDLRDVTSGTNGSCGTDCTAGAGYDLVTGLGSPINYIASPGELPSGAVLTSGQSITTPNGQYSLTMETNGNAVESGPSDSVVFETNTSGNTGADLIMQGDGNLVLYSSGGAALWASGTVGSAGAYLVLPNNGQLAVDSAAGATLWSAPTAATLPSGAVLTSGQSITTPNGQYSLTMETNGNAVESGPSDSVVFETNTSGNTGADLIMQGDGNLVLYSSGGAALWASGTVGSAGAYLVLPNNGQLAVDSAAGATLWSAPTAATLPSGAVLTSGQSITTPNGQYSLTMETNGNAVESGPSDSVVFETNTSGTRGRPDHAR